MPGFEFSVRCQRDLAELHRFELTHKTIRIIDSMEKTCKRLKATVLTILVPKALVGDIELASKLNNFLSTTSFGETRIAIEFRGGDPTEDTLKILRDYNAVYCVDLSTQDPEVDSSMLYSRLFGKGKENIYEFDDNELQSIATKASGPKFEKSILAFHGVRMYGDAARLKTFLNSGKFPSLTGQVGLGSLGEILKEDARFPTTKSQLIEEQGWKLYDKSGEERARAREVLEKLPARTYPTLDDVLASLKRAVL